jgi:hypothetical protein
MRCSRGALASGRRAATLASIDAIDAGRMPCRESSQQPRRSAARSMPSSFAPPASAAPTEDRSRRCPSSCASAAESSASSSRSISGRLTSMLPPRQAQAPRSSRAETRNVVRSRAGIPWASERPRRSNRRLASILESSRPMFARSTLTDAGSPQPTAKSNSAGRSERATPACSNRHARENHSRGRAESTNGAYRVGSPLPIWAAVTGATSRRVSLSASTSR